MTDNKEENKEVEEEEYDCGGIPEFDGIPESLIKKLEAQRAELVAKEKGEHRNSEK